MVDYSNNVTVSKADIKKVFSTPKECFDFLTLDVAYHLPPRPYTDMDWMKEIWDGTRKAVKAKDVNVQRVASIKNLRTDDIIAFIKSEGFEAYLPPPKKKKISEKFSRPWLVTVSP